MQGRAKAAQRKLVPFETSTGVEKSTALAKVVIEIFAPQLTHKAVAMAVDMAITGAGRDEEYQL